MRKQCPCSIVRIKLGCAGTVKRRLCPSRSLNGPTMVARPWTGQFACLKEARGRMAGCRQVGWRYVQKWPEPGWKSHQMPAKIQRWTTPAQSITQIWHTPGTSSSSSWYSSYCQCCSHQSLYTLAYVKSLATDLSTWPCPPAAPNLLSSSWKGQRSTHPECSLESMARRLCTPCCAQSLPIPRAGSCWTEPNPGVYEFG